MPVIREQRGVIRSFAATLATKPFLILAGISGSGKTQLARNLAAGIAAGQWDGMAYRRRLPLSEGSLLEGLSTILVESGVVPELLASTDPCETLDVHPLRSPIQRTGLIDGEVDEGRKSYRDVLRNRVAFLPVRPDWKDARQLWGTYNPLTGLFYPSEALRVVLHALFEFIDLGDEAGRHVLILDEMNLSRVEYYMSDLLSLMETSAQVVEGDRRRLGELVNIHPYARPLWTISPPRFVGEAPRASEQLYLGKLDRGWGLAMAYLCAGSGNLVLDRIGVDFDEVIDGADWHRIVPPRICLPPNLTIIGTVNVDETTFSFAPKVLDRAFVIEFDEMDYEGVCGQWPGFDAIREPILSLGAILKPARLHFGYRVVNEFLEFLEVTGGTWASDGDFLIASKILPKIRGTGERLGPVLERLLEYCLGLESGRLPRRMASAHSELAGLVNALGLEGDIPHPRSARRVLELLVELDQTGVTSFM